MRLVENFQELCNCLDQGPVNHSPSVKSDQLSFLVKFGTQPGTFVYILSIAAVVLWWNIEKL